MSDWAVALQSAIDQFFEWLPMLSMLGGVAVIILLLKKLGSSFGGKRGRR